MTVTVTVTVTAYILVTEYYGMPGPGTVTSESESGVWIYPFNDHYKKGTDQLQVETNLTRPG